MITESRIGIWGLASVGLVGGAYSFFAAQPLGVLVLSVVGGIRSWQWWREYYFGPSVTTYDRSSVCLASTTQRLSKPRAIPLAQRLS